MMETYNKTPEFSDILEASQRLEGYGVKTPLVRSDVLDTLVGGRVYLKPECLQKTGSFKFRGAWNFISRLNRETNQGGVVAYSSGNHAQGVAAAAAMMGLPALIVMPEDAPGIKKRNTIALGAEIVTYDRFTENREAIGGAIAAERNAMLVPPYEHPWIIAGQGTAGLELVRDLEERDEKLDAMLVCTGGGGLTAGIALALEGSPGLVLAPGFGFRMTAVVSLVAGTMFLMWLGEQITERGLGNGISILIFGGIVAGLPSAIGGLFELVRTGSMSIIASIFIIAVVIFVTFAVVFVERGQRKILVNYAKRQVGNKVYGGQSSHLPLKLNMAGVIPPIFASSIILLPATVVGWFATGEGMRWLRDLSSALSPGQPIYVLLYAAMIVFFCFFYTALVFNSRETADNLKKSGAFIPGIRPGDQTARHIDKILLRLTFAGAIYITAVCLLPEFLILKYNVPFYFGGTSLLIIVVVTMDFWSQVQSYVMSQQYESLLKKANFKTS